MRDEQIIIRPNDGAVIVHEGLQIVEVGTMGPPGPPGPAGSGNDFEQTFSSPLLTWVVNHNLGRRPFVSLLNTGSIEIVGDVVHVNLNQLTINFAVPTAGTVRCL